MAYLRSTNSRRSAKRAMFRISEYVIRPYLNKERFSPYRDGVTELAILSACITNTIEYEESRGPCALTLPDLAT